MHLRKVFLMLILVPAILAGVAERQASGQAASQRKPRVAVLDFEYGTVESASAAIFGTNVDLGKGITNLLITDLVKNGAYSIIERAALDKILSEQNFSNSNRADAASAAQLGKILGADYIIVGAITEFGNESNHQNVGGGGGNFHGFGLGGIGHSNSKANVAINARVVNVDTAEIMAVAEGKGDSSRSGISLLGGGGNWHGFGGGAVDLGSSNFQNTIIGEATKKAVDALEADLISNAPRLPVHTFKAEGLIAAVDGGEIVLNVGARAGIHKGDILDVVRVGREIKDPATGQVIRRLTSSIGTLQAVDVDDVSTVCSVVSGSGFSVGDHVSFTTSVAPSGGGMASRPAPAQVRSGYAQPSPAQPSAVASEDAQASSGQPDLKAIQVDFVPGEKVFFFDDFSDMAGDEPPAHWKVRGGTAELRVAGNLRELAIHHDSTLTPNLTSMPRNFTLDYQMLFADHWQLARWLFPDKTGKIVMTFAARRNYGALWVTINAGDEQIYDGQTKENFTQPVRMEYSMQNGRMRVYLNGERVCDVNQIQIPEIQPPHLEIAMGENRDASYVGLRAVRFAETTPDFGQMITSTGKFVTHGILFDTDSDRLKPESASVIKSIARGLEMNPNLKVEIDGHTDSTGAAEHNMDLSKRRAEAVKTVLVSQFNVDASRLTAKGFGSTKPIDSNNTPQGKANNRRVEFVRQ